MCSSFISYFTNISIKEHFNTIVVTIEAVLSSVHTLLFLDLFLRSHFSQAKETQVWKKVYSDYMDS